MDISGMTLRHAAGETFLIDSEVVDGIYHKPICINPAGERIVSMLVSGMSIEETAGRIAGEEDVDRAVVEQDIRDFLALIEENYVVWN